MRSFVIKAFLILTMWVSTIAIAFVVSWNLLNCISVWFLIYFSVKIIYYEYENIKKLLNDFILYSKNNIKPIIAGIFIYILSIRYGCMWLFDE